MLAAVIVASNTGAQQPQPGSALPAPRLFTVFPPGARAGTVRAAVIAAALAGGTAAGQGLQGDVHGHDVGIDLMAAEAGELVDRRARDALAELAGRLGRGGVAGGLYGFPERRRCAVGLRERRMRLRCGVTPGPEPRAPSPEP